MADEESPKLSPAVKKDGTMTFVSCLDKLILGERCRRVSWEDKRIYITMKDEKLMIFGTADKLLHPLTVSAGDIDGKDWVVVAKMEEVS